MPSFDVVSKLEFQEIDNALSNSMKEITQRYDFKGSISKLERSDKVITLSTEDELKAKQVIDFSLISSSFSFEIISCASDLFAIRFL